LEYNGENHGLSFVFGRNIKREREPVIEIEKTGKKNRRMSKPLGGSLQTSLVIGDVRYGVS
jgi:hypothetical protein